MKKNLTTVFLVVLPFLPLLLFVVPVPFVMLDERSEWYTEYTTPLFFLSAIYASPATAVSSLFGDSAYLWWPCLLTYASAISYGIYRLRQR